MDINLDHIAERLTALGCTAEQVDRHLKPYRNLAARARKRKQAQRTTVTRDTGKHPVPAFYLTPDQIDALLPKLREREWWRSVAAKPKDDDGSWIGDAILSITGTPRASYHLPYLMGDVVAQLLALGLIQKDRIYINGHTRINIVRVLECRGPRERLPRERLDHAEQPLVSCCGKLQGRRGERVQVEEKPISQR